MKKKFVRLMSLLLVVLFVLTAFAGCGSDKKNEGANSTGSASDSTNAAASTTKPEEKKVPEKYVELVWYVVANPHKDEEMVNRELNKRLKEDLNANVKINFTSWANWQSKYNLLLVSGEAIDMIYAASWADFNKYAKMGCYLDISELLPKYAPQTWANVPKEDWECVTFDGAIYAVPCTLPEFVPKGWFYREDLRKKYNLPEIKDVASIEAYLDAIAKNEPDMVAIQDSIDQVPSLYFWSNKYEDISADYNGLIKIKSYDTPRDIIIYPFTDEFVEFCKMTQEWAGKGYWPKDILSSKVNAEEGLKAGKVATYWRNPAGAYGLFVTFAKEHPEWEGGYFPFTRLKGYSVASLPINNGMAVPVTASNPERSLMVLDLLRHDKDYHRLSTYGIEGYHWQLSEDGTRRITPAEGQDPTVNEGYWTTSWGWANYKLALSDVLEWSGKDAMEAEFRSMQRPNIYEGIKIDKDPIKVELAAVEQVRTKYARILFMGLADDVEKTIQDFRNELNKAGIQKVYEEYKRQIYQYYDEIGIE